ncbi:MAG: winged helix-turn-helix domain-containing protein [Chthoniobacterales bacterium]
MKKTSRNAAAFRIRPRIRLYSGEDIALGPGKVELLRKIAETSSLSEAARQMKISYMKAWLLVKVMNHCFKNPRVTLTRGGQSGGGTTVTAYGLKVIDLYETLKADCLAAMKPSAKKLRALLSQ